MLRGGDIIIAISGRSVSWNLTCSLNNLLMLGMLSRLLIMLDSLREDIMLIQRWRGGFWCRVWREVLEWLDLAEELPVPFCDGSGAINADMVTVVRAHLYYNTSLVPLAGVLATLVLNSNLVTLLEGLERFAGI